MKKIFIIVSLMMFLVIWETAAYHSSSLKFFVSSPSDSIRYASTHIQNIFTSTMITSIEAFSGFAISIVFSFTIMFFCLLSPSILKIVLPIFIASQVLPIITLAPLFIILFGMGLLSKIAMVVFDVLLPYFYKFCCWC